MAHLPSYIEPPGLTLIPPREVFLCPKIFSTLLQLRVVNTFSDRYASLNPAQKQAVDTIDGPVMVVAGPGTGKTELLSMRVANILRTTDVLPQNILCLTYTESGAFAMRERLAGLIGPEAYKVAVHTFHSFGAEIINRNAEYFYNGAHFRPADELSSYEILQKIFETLPHDDVLASRMNEDFTYLRDTQSAISDIKKSGLTSDELNEILQRNQRFIEWLRPRLSNVFGERVSKKMLPSIQKLIDDISMYEEDEYHLVTYEPLSSLVGGTLEFALEQTDTDGTKPITAWKKEWCEKRVDGELTIKDEKRGARLRSVSKIYYEYLLAMQKRELYDFDDMILRSVHAMEVFDDLRSNLQEQYQYILVDEFQDTNDAQMRLLWNLTNNPASEGRPNIMTVGDDDQAIYRFQGAKLSNILDFRNLYRDVAVITLTDNYRSAEPILISARKTIIQAEERLERTLPNLDKTLTAHHNPVEAEVSFDIYEDEASEYALTTKHIAAERLQNPERTIAVIARHHKQLQALLPYLQHEKIPLSYDRRDNVLESEPIKFLELLSRVVDHIAHQDLLEANSLLPELLAHKSWGLDSETLWKLSLDSHKNRQLWIETMLSNEGPLSQIAEWLIYSAHISLHEPLEFTIDHLAGNTANQLPDTTDEESDQPDNLRKGTDFISPLKNFFFSQQRLEAEPDTYLFYLDALTSIRQKVRDYRQETQLTLHDFIRCLEQYKALGIAIQGSGRVVADGNPVELLTAHRSKGLEFDAVYVIGLSDVIWGGGSGRRGKLINYPHNLPIGISGDTSDEHIRLLFVALTRAKTKLLMGTHELSLHGRRSLPVAYLNHTEPIEQAHTAPRLETLQISWHAEVTSSFTPTMAELLSDRLEKYKLSATHLCNFVDVSQGGPERFLLQNLLRFPQAMSPSAAFGSAIHATLHRAHAHLTATGKKRPVEDLMGDFETVLQDYQLPHDQYEHFAKKGSDVLSYYLARKYDYFSPTQLVELSFGTESVVVDGVRLTGAVDLIEVDEETKRIYVTDYKTGKPTATWQGKTDYEKIKLHHYKQQLMFYKLLLENSRQFSGYTVALGYIEYVEADSAGTLHRLELSFDTNEMTEFKTLMCGVWKRIQALDFSTADNYDQNLSGIKAFETELTN